MDLDQRNLRVHTMPTTVEENLSLVPLHRPNWRTKETGERRLAKGFATPFFVADTEHFWTQLWLQPQQMGPEFFPLVLFGPSGTGKTMVAEHLTWAWIDASGVRPGQKRANPLIISAVDFARRVARHADTDTFGDVRRSLLSAPAVMIDDCHHLEHYPVGQTFLVPLIDLLAEQKTPLVMTSLSPPNAWNSVSEQLISRIGAGLALPMSPPGPVARRWILERLLASEGLVLTPSALQFLVDQCPWTYPRLQQLISDIASPRRVVNALASRRPLGVSVVAAIVERPHRNTQQLLERLCGEVAKEFQATVRAMRSPSRRQALVLARDVAIYLARQLLKLGFTDIGRFFGNRDHSTIIHAYEKIERVMSGEQELYARVTRLAVDLEWKMAVWDRENDSRSSIPSPVGKDCR